MSIRSIGPTRSTSVAEAEEILKASRLRRLLLLRAVLGERDRDFPERYDRAQDRAQGRDQEPEWYKALSSAARSSVGGEAKGGGRDGRRPFRLGSAESAKLCPVLKSNAHRSLGHIMNTQFIDQAFTSLRDGKKSLAEIEQTVRSLIESVKVPGGNILKYLESKSQPEGLLDDATVLTKAKGERIADLSAFGELTAEETTYVIGFDKADLPTLFKGLTYSGRLPDPMQPSGKPRYYKIHLNLPPTYHAKPLQEEAERITARVTGGEQVPESETLALKEKMDAMGKAALEYWEGVFRAYSERVAEEVRFTNEIGLIKEAQLAEARRAVSDSFDFLRFARPLLIKSMIVLTQANMSEKHITLADAKKAIHSLLSALNPALAFDSAQVLNDLILMPKVPSAVQKYLSTLGVPLEMASSVAGKRRMDQVMFVMGWIVADMVPK